MLNILCLEFVIQLIFEILTVSGVGWFVERQQLYWLYNLVGHWSGGSVWINPVVFEELMPQAATFPDQRFFWTLHHVFL